MRFYAIVLFFLSFVTVLIYVSGRGEPAFYIAADAETTSLLPTWSTKPPNRHHVHREPRESSARDAWTR
jgi:hypothetical protein